MEIYRDPAITKYGQSYERAVLLEHLKRVGGKEMFLKECVHIAIISFFWASLSAAE